MKATSSALCVLSVLVLSGGTATFSQTANQPARQPGGPLPPADTEVGKLLPVSSSAPMTPEMEAERVKIWNSPTMLRARAWAQEYCHASARVTPEEAKDYMNELQRMTPTQMKLWLLKFEHEQEMMARQQAMFEQQRRAGVQQALGIDRGIQQAYGRINRDENEAAQVEERTLNEERLNAQENSRMNQQNLNLEGAGYGGGLGYGYGYGYGPLGYGPYGGYGPAAHYHFHYY
jgi:hypothetical protein